MYMSRDGPRIRLAPQTVQRVKNKIRDLTARSKPMSVEERVSKLNEYLRGWVGYFHLADAKNLCEELDGWVRRRLRMCLWKQWKRVRTRIRELRALGLPDWRCFELANSRKGCWHMSHAPLNSALNAAYWQAQGLLRLSERYRELRSA